MKKFTFLGVLFIALILGGCGSSTDKNTDKMLSGDKPPNVILKIDGEKYETILGSYCWDISDSTDVSEGLATVECSDTAGPLDLLKDKEPIQIKAGEEITLNMDYTPKPNETHLYLSQIESDEIETEINDNQFTAPDEKGIYYYSYGVWWLDEKDENLSHGDASYVFVIEVK